jgi:hypothetical protein
MNTSQWRKISLMTCHFDPDCPTVPVVPVIYIRGQKNQRIHHTISREVLLFYWDTGTPQNKILILHDLLVSRLGFQTKTTGTARADTRSKVRGARYFAQLYMRTAPGQTPQDALREFLGPLAEEVEIEDG